MKIKAIPRRLRHQPPIFKQPHPPPILHVIMNKSLMETLGDKLACLGLREWPTEGQIFVHPRHRGNKTWKAWMDVYDRCTVLLDCSLRSNATRVALRLPGNCMCHTITVDDLAPNGSWRRTVLGQIRDFMDLLDSGYQCWMLSVPPGDPVFSKENMEVMTTMEARTEDIAVDSDFGDVLAALVVSNHRAYAEDFVTTLEAAVAYCGILGWRVVQIAVGCSVGGRGAIHLVAIGRYTDREGVKDLKVMIPTHFDSKVYLGGQRFFMERIIKDLEAFHKQKTRDNMRVFLMGIYVPRTKGWRSLLSNLLGINRCYLTLLRKEIVQIIGDHLLQLEVGKEVSRIFGDRVLRL